MTRVTKAAPEATKTAPEATKTAPEATKTAPEATKTAPEATKTAPGATKTAPEATVQASFRGLADPTRRQILQRLQDRDMTIAEVAGHFDMTRAAVKKHLVILQEGNLITVQPRGRERMNRLNPAGMKAAVGWFAHFDRFWDDKLARLQTALNEDKTDDG